MNVETDGKMISGIVMCPECRLQIPFNFDVCTPAIDCAKCGGVVRFRLDNTPMSEDAE